MLRSDAARRPAHLVIVGPTASGKTAVATEIAGRYPDAVEVVSVDSMQVYRGMDIGTAKPTAAERAAVPHHLIDIIEPTEEFSVAEFQRRVEDALAGIEERGRVAMLVGGTGLYVRSIVDNLDIPGQWPELRAELQAAATARGAPALHARLVELDPVAARRMEPTNDRRIVRALEVTIGSGRPFSSFGPGLEAYPDRPAFFQTGLAIPRGELTERIERRFMTMIDAGLLDEVRALVERCGEALSRTAGQALGYRELIAYVQGRVTLEAATAEAIQRTRTFAVRQERWFRRDPRIRWFSADNPVATADAILGDWRPR